MKTAEARIIGNVASAILARAPEEARIAALFRRSFYLGLGADLLCFGGPEIGAGPINVVCDFPGAALPDGLAAGRTARLEPGRLVLSGGLHIGLARAGIWTPPEPPPFDPARLSRGLALLDSHFPQDVPEDGLAAFIHERPQPQGFVACAAAPAVAALSAWLGRPEGEPPAAALDALVGLGPGLTPSGDDLLGGALCSLRALGLASAADRLAAALAERGAATTPISRAHLAAAASGAMADRLHRLLDAVMAGDETDLRNGLTALAEAPGHNSPWDALAGIVLALRGPATA